MKDLQPVGGMVRRDKHTGAVSELPIWVQTGGEFPTPALLIGKNNDGVLIRTEGNKGAPLAVDPKTLARRQ